jgi:hypothetical protein
MRRAISLLVLLAAASVGGAPASAAIVVHAPDEVLARYCRLVDGILWLELPDGHRFELVTDTADPAISNPGDGSFHPFDPAEVRAAIAALRYPMHDVSADVFALPYPRRHGLESAAAPGIVLLSPGVRPLAPERQHAEVAHELGHVVHHRHLPDLDREGWSRYRALRGIDDESVFRADAPHADRPHEIFAEDFRALFGGSLADYSGSIENPRITPPAAVPGLESFLRGLAGAPVALLARPNPARGAMDFFTAGGAPGALDLFDIGGRRVVSLEARPSGAGWTWRWDGRDASGAEMPPGVLLARVRGSAGTLRIVRRR